MQDAVLGLVQQRVGGVHHHAIAEASNATTHQCYASGSSTTCRASRESCRCDAEIRRAGMRRPFTRQAGWTVAGQRSRRATRIPAARRRKGARVISRIQRAQVRCSFPTPHPAMSAAASSCGNHPRVRLRAGPSVSAGEELADHPAEQPHIDQSATRDRLRGHSQSSSSSSQPMCPTSSSDGPDAPPRNGLTRPPFRGSLE